MSPYQTIKTDKGSAGFSLAVRLQGFRYAASGIAFMLRTQPNAWVHLACSLIVIAIGWQLEIAVADWRWLIVSIALVWMAEALNTAIEHVCDVVSPEYHSSVEKAKDIAAGAVLICACGAVALGILTFWPYL